MAKKQRNQGMLGSAMNKGANFMQEMGSELGLTEPSKTNRASEAVTARTAKRS